VGKVAVEVTERGRALGTSATRVVYSPPVA
jgi:hypothetical protein